MITKLPMFPGILFDDEGQALTVISEPHAMNHRGKMFHTFHKFSAVADAASVEILIKVGAAELHLQKFRVSVGAGDVDWFLYEGATSSADGTGMVETCTNREAANTPTATFFHTPTLTGDGTQIFQHWVPPSATGVGQSAAGISNSEAGEEWELDASTDYMQRITNNSGGSIDIFVEYLWYEP